MVPAASTPASRNCNLLLNHAGNSASWWPESLPNNAFFVGTIASAATSREFLDKAHKSHGEFNRGERTTPAWHTSVDFETVRREAEAVVSEGKKP